MSSGSRVSELEVLESRELLATFTVTNLHNSGAGSLRQAIIASNAQAGPNTIDFDVTGTIRVARTSLPAITNTVTIDGSSAPSFAGTPVVTVNFQGSRGLNFAKGSDGSILKSLALVRAGNAGVTLTASKVTVQGNDIGLLSDGTTAAGNRGDGVRINTSSHGDLIGQSNPVSSISYYLASALGISEPVSGWQGIRESGTSSNYLITGTSDTNGLLYDGPISGGGTGYLVDYPGATSTSVYGPDLLANGDIRLVGTYNNGIVNGFAFPGHDRRSLKQQRLRDDRLSRREIHVYPQYDGRPRRRQCRWPGGQCSRSARATRSSTILPTTRSCPTSSIRVRRPRQPTASGTTAARAIRSAAATARLPGQSGATGNAYLVDYNSATDQFTNWASFAYPNGAIGQNFVTHFQGISSTEQGVYTLSADSGQSGSTSPLQGSWVTVRRNTDGSFGPAAWVDLTIRRRRELHQ